jgi:hypothetical protein
VKRANPSFQVIHQPNKLKDLVGGQASVDDDLLAKAEAAAQAVVNSIDMAETCKADLEAMSDAVESLSSGDKDPSHEKRIYGIMHDLRGQGASFGYPLVTRIATSMNHYLDSGTAGKRGKADLDVIRAHVDAVKGVLTNRLKGETGQIGLQIVSGLEAISGLRVEGNH